MDKEPKAVRVIPRENAVFRLDKHGNWHGENGKFTNKKIIKHFHSHIKRDKDGFFLEQEHRHYIEKVYFPYEDTVLFVSRITEGSRPVMCINTGAQIPLDPRKLFTKNDDLYYQNGEDLIKFNENALLSLAGYLDEVDDKFAIVIDGEKHIIPGMEE